MNDKHASDNRPGNPGIPPFPADNDGGLPLPSWVQAFLEQDGGADLLANAGLQEAALAAPAAPDGSEDEFGDEESVWLTPPLDDYSELLAELDRLAAEGETAAETVAAALEEEAAPVVEIEVAPARDEPSATEPQAEPVQIQEQAPALVATIAQPDEEPFGESEPEPIQVQEQAPALVATIAQPDEEPFGESEPEPIQVQEQAPALVAAIAQPDEEPFGESEPEPIQVQEQAPALVAAIAQPDEEPFGESEPEPIQVQEQAPALVATIAQPDEEPFGESEPEPIQVQEQATALVGTIAQPDEEPFGESEPEPIQVQEQAPAIVAAIAQPDEEPFGESEPEPIQVQEQAPAIVAAIAQPDEEPFGESEPEPIQVQEQAPALVAAIARPDEEPFGESEPEPIQVQEQAPALVAAIAQPDEEPFGESEPEPIQVQEQAPALVAAIAQPDEEPLDSAEQSESAPAAATPIRTESLPDSVPEGNGAGAWEPPRAASQADHDTLEEFEFDHSMLSLDDEEMEGEFDHWMLPLNDEDTVTPAEVEDDDVAPALPAHAEPEFLIAAEAVAEQPEVVAEQTDVDATQPDVEQELHAQADSEPESAGLQETDPVLIAARALLARVLAGKSWDDASSAGEDGAQVSTEASPILAEQPSPAPMAGETDNEPIPEEPAEAAGSPSASLAETIGGIEQEMADTAAPAVPETAGSTDHLLAFQLGNGTYAVDVHEIVRLDAVPKTTPVPHVPDYIHGVTNLRGEIIALVDMRTLLSLDAIQDSNQERMLVVQTGRQRLLVGLIVDGVKGMAAVSSDTVRPPSGAVSDKVAPFLRGVCQHEGHFMTVLDLDRLMDSQEMRGFWAN